MKDGLLQMYTSTGVVTISNKLDRLNIQSISPEIEVLNVPVINYKTAGVGFMSFDSPEDQVIASIESKEIRLTSLSKGYNETDMSMNIKESLIKMHIYQFLRETTLTDIDRTVSDYTMQHLDEQSVEYAKIYYGSDNLQLINMNGFYILTDLDDVGCFVNHAKGTIGLCWYRNPVVFRYNINTLPEFIADMIKNSVRS